MTDRSAFILRGGPAAIAHVTEHGLAPSDIACIPAAAGGPKGLALLPLDRLLHAEWLKHAAQIELIGASIGAWRMAALAQPEPLAALDRLQHAYVHEQRYPAKPTPFEVSRACRRLAAAVLGEGDLEVRKGVALTIVTARARGPLAHAESKLAFGRAMLSNSLSRRRLAAYLERVVFQAGERVVPHRALRRIRPGARADRRRQPARRAARLGHDPARCARRCATSAALRTAATGTARSSTITCCCPTRG